MSRARGAGPFVALTLALLAVPMPAAAQGGTAPFLTDDERAFVAENAPFDLVRSPRAAPLSFNQEGIPVGIASDFTRLIEVRTGVTFRLVDAANGTDMIERMLNGSADVAFTVAISPERREVLLFTTPYAALETYAWGPLQDAARRETGFAGDTLAIVGRSTQEAEARAAFPAAILLPVGSTRAALDAVANGTALAVVGSLPVLAYESGRDPAFLEFGPLGAPIGGALLALSTRRDLPMLAGILQKGLDSITPEERRAIFVKWTGRDLSPGVAVPPSVAWTTVLQGGGIALGALVVVGVPTWIVLLRRQVRRRTAELQKSHALLADAQATAHLGTWEQWLREDRGVWSPEMRALFGLAPDAPTPDTAGMLALVHPDDRDRVVRETQRAWSEGRFSLEHRIVRADGSTRWVRTSGHVTDADEEGPLRLLGTVLDITGLVDAQQRLADLNAHLEARIEEATRDLRASNAELEAFGYSVTHDLKTPLRAIQGFSQYVLQHDAAKLDERGKQDLARIVDASRRMDELILSLLTLSRLTRTRVRRDVVDLGDFARATLEAHRVALPERQVDALVEDDLVVEGDPDLLRQVVENLVDNAWKFSGTRDVAHIRVGKTTVGGEQAFFVRDDGVGFDPAFAPKLFTPFQRLHAASDFPGNGVGLAIVARAIHRHGGRVWAEGAVGQGATMWFTVPARSATASILPEVNAT